MQAMGSQFLHKKKEQKNGRTSITRCHDNDDDDDHNYVHNYVNDDGCRTRHGSLGCLFHRESAYTRSKEDGKATACQAGR
jgi:hypothetical protein